MRHKRLSLTQVLASRPQLKRRMDNHFETLTREFPNQIPWEISPEIPEPDYWDKPPTSKDSELSYGFQKWASEHEHLFPDIWCLKSHPVPSPNNPRRFYIEKK